MATAPTSSRPGTVDPETGRLLPLTAEERKARVEVLTQWLEEAPDADETDTDEVWSEVFRDIDESRPHRPLFEGRY